MDDDTRHTRDSLFVQTEESPVPVTPAKTRSKSRESIDSSEASTPFVLNLKSRYGKQLLAREAKNKGKRSVNPSTSVLCVCGAAAKKGEKECGFCLWLK